MENGVSIVKIGMRGELEGLLLFEVKWVKFIVVIKWLNYILCLGWIRWKILTFFETEKKYFRDTENLYFGSLTIFV